MELTPGAKLGPYEILSRIGEGGMGQVWKARDTRLDRIVAVKTSHAKFSERFEREAHTVAALNHPHICTLYDVGADYLVMEYVEGSEIKGPLPLDQALKLAIQLASALEAAHRKTITHRDLKPSNILVTRAGVKVLDFGLAKFEQTKEVKANDETLTRALTQEGAIVGTLQYMAPEQLQGKPTDTRADLFAFGCVLYEMLTGKRAFDGTSNASVIAAILERPAPSVKEVAPAALDRVLGLCLEKDPDERWQSAHDLKSELMWIASGEAEISRRPESHSSSKKWLWAAASLLMAAIAALAGWKLSPTPSTPVIRTVIALGTDEHLANLNGTVIAISPHGANLVYVASRGGGPAQLFRRPLDALKDEPMAGTEGAASPFFSPDGQWIGFTAAGKLEKVGIGGGAAITLCDVDSGTGSAFPGATWSPHNTIVFQGSSSFREVPATGGATSRLLTTAKSLYWRWPEFTPDGSAIVFANGTNPLSFVSKSSIATAAFGGAGTAKELISGGTAPRLTATGDLVYAQSGILMAVPFNSRRLELAGSPSPVLEGIQESRSGAAQYSLSASGTLVYVPGGLQSSMSRLVWVDRQGNEQPLAAPARGYYFPRLSPDGRRIAVGIIEASSDIWLYDIERDALSRATSGSTDLNPIWSPDGNRLAFFSDRAGAQNIFWQPADGSRAAERLTTSQFINVTGAWSPDGQRIAFMENNAETGNDIWTVGLEDRKAQPFLKTPANETAPRFSPDGQWIAYASDEAGRWDIYVRPYPGPGARYPISTEGGMEPVWNPAGRELFYRTGNRMMAVDVSFASGFSAGKPRVLLEGPWLPTPLTTANYDVSRDGKRFLMLKSAAQDNGARQIVVVQNWFEVLKKRNR
ncbi:MAG: protein kinase [Acidobacteriia bacterium]|nr:protein kinase [Terriglobia bacterium]